VAISEDTSNQPVAVHVTSATTGTTASFSPGAATLQLALVAVNGPNNSATTVVMSSSVAGTWTLLKRENINTGVTTGGSTEVWCRYFGSAPGSMTVTATWTTGAVGGNLVVRSLLGAAPVQPGASGATGGDSVAPTATLTPTKFGSWIYGASLAWVSAITFTANAASSVVDQFVDSTNGGTWATFKGSAATSSLVSTAYGFSNGSASYNTAAAEILPAVVQPTIIGQSISRATIW
jgi:hypothetical protein